MPYVVKIGSFVIVLQTVQEALRLVKQMPMHGDLTITDLDGREISLADIRAVAEPRSKT